MSRCGNQTAATLSKDYILKGILPVEESPARLLCKVYYSDTHLLVAVLRNYLTKRGALMYGDRRRFEQPKFLSGWKEIATYLGKGVRTVQRYERDFGLPVRCPAGKDRAAVLATKAELDAWVGASPIRETFHLSRMSGSMSGTAVLGINESVAEMHRLREQMASLRNDLRTSLRMLHAGLSSLQMGLDRSCLNATRRGMTVVDPHHRSEYMLQLLDIDPRRKAS